MPNHSTIIIRTIPELQRLATKKNVAGLLGRQRLSLLLPQLDEQERQSLEARMNVFLGDCGCSMGAVFSLVAIVMTVVYEIMSAEFSLHAIALALLLVMIAAFFSGLVGKLLGLYVAKARFRRICNALLQRLSPLHPLHSLTIQRGRDV